MTTYNPLVLPHFNYFSAIWHDSDAHVLMGNASAILNNFKNVKNIIIICLVMTVDYF